eukprot:6209458-Pleurochrysis_carterae.AAC.1
MSDAKLPCKYDAMRMGMELRRRLLRSTVRSFGKECLLWRSYSQFSLQHRAETAGSEPAVLKHPKSRRAKEFGEGVKVEMR